MSDSLSDRAAASAMEQSQPSPDRTTLIAFFTFILIGGGVAIAILYTYDEIAPYWSGVLRFGTAALIFWILLVVRRVPVPRGRALMGAVLFGSLSVGASFIFVYYGLTNTPAGLFQTTVAIVPLFTILFAAAHKLEPLRRRSFFGGLLAVAGIAIAVSGSLQTGVEISLPHILAIIAGAACFAEAGIVIKLFPPSHPYATNAIGMTVGTLMLASASLIRGEIWILPSSTTTWVALIYIIVPATVGGFLLYLFILRRWTATGTSFAIVLVPIVTVVLANILLDETISLIFLAGAAVVFIGVYISALMPTKKAAEPAIPAVTTEPVLATDQVPATDPALATIPALATEPTLDDLHARPGVPTCV